MDTRSKNTSELSGTAGANRESICLAGGCFWGTQHFLKQIDGVVATEAGYANSDEPDPTYREVCSGRTNAAEAVMVTYDTSRVGLDFILRLFFMTIDPTSVNRQGNDHGTQYRTGIYYTSPGQVEVIDSAVGRLAEEYDRPIAVEVMPLRNFYPAEDYHQDYLDKNPTWKRDLRKRAINRFCTEIQYITPIWEKSNNNPFFGRQSNSSRL